MRINMKINIKSNMRMILQSIILVLVLSACMQPQKKTNAPQDNPISDNELTFYTEIFTNIYRSWKLDLIVLSRQVSNSQEMELIKAFDLSLRTKEQLSTINIEMLFWLFEKFSAILNSSQEEFEIRIITQEYLKKERNL